MKGYDTLFSLVAKNISSLFAPTKHLVMELEKTMDIYEHLQEDLQQIAEQNIPVLQCRAKCLEKTRRSIKELEGYIVQFPMADQPQEIEYFKSVYPLFFGELFFQAEYFNLEKNLLSCSKEAYEQYFNDERKIIDRFFIQNSFWVQYYLLGGTELDGIYFVKSESESLFIQQPVISDSLTCNSASMIYARIAGYNKLKEAISTRTAFIRNYPNQVNKAPLKWTGETINLVELAYGIWLTGQINNGTATIAEIIEWLEEIFSVKIGRPYRRWWDIARRKVISQTKYTDEMIVQIRKRIASDLSMPGNDV